MGKKKNKSNKYVHTPKPAAEQPVVQPEVAAVPEEVIAESTAAPVAETKTLDTTPQVDLLDKQPIAVAMEPTPDVATAATSSRSNKYTIITVVLVVIALLVVLFQLEKQDRIGTNLFGPMIAAMEANAPVAVVNGEKITTQDIESGMAQLTQTAVAQGFDSTDPQVQSEIRSQAVDMLVNTKLLEQAAVTNNITLDNDVVDARITELEESAGGRDALMERLTEFGIDEDQLRSDVTDELTIRALLATVYSPEDIQVTQQEIDEVYDNAVQASAGQPLPPIEEVASQIEQQLIQSKEQEAVEAYLQELRAGADIELK